MPADNVAKRSPDSEAWHEMFWTNWKGGGRRQDSLSKSQRCSHFREGLVKGGGSVPVRAGSGWRESQERSLGALLWWKGQAPGQEPVPLLSSEACWDARKLGPGLKAEWRVEGGRSYMACESHY